ncbi:hypothetical protein MHBO_004564, partial [Bonamia ostreae]
MKRDLKTCEQKHRFDIQNINQQRAFDAENHKLESNKLKDETKRNKELTGQLAAVNNKLTESERTVTRLTVDRDRYKSHYEDTKEHLKKAESRNDKIETLNRHQQQQVGGNGTC